jgi:hypothetical protein
MDKITKAVIRLNELTQKGSVKWRKDRLPEMIAKRDYSDIAFVTEYEGERLRVYTRRYKVPGYEVNFEGEWAVRPVLEVIDEAGKTLYEFPSTPATRDLINTVQYQVSGVGSLIDKLASGG